MILLSAQDYIIDDAITYGLKNIIPLYNVVGFWPIQKPQSSSAARQVVCVRNQCIVSEQSGLFR